MGSIIAFEVARELKRRTWPVAEWILASSAVAPRQRRSEDLHRLPSEEFLRVIAACYHSAPQEATPESELLRLAEPVLKADFELIENYCFVPDGLLPSKIMAFGGSDDPRVPSHDLRCWRELTAAPGQSRVIVMSGGHFYLREQRDQLLATIAHLCQT